MRVLRDAGGEVPKEMDRFPSTIKKKGEFYPSTPMLAEDHSHFFLWSETFADTFDTEHGSYGAFYKDTTNAPPPTKITFD